MATLSDVLKELLKEIRMVNLKSDGEASFDSSCDRFGESMRKICDAWQSGRANHSNTRLFCHTTLAWMLPEGTHDSYAGWSDTELREVFLDLASVLRGITRHERKERILLALSSACDQHLHLYAPRMEPAGQTMHGRPTFSIAGGTDYTPSRKA